MDKLTRLSSLTLCLSRTGFISRHQRCLHWRKRDTCFSTDARKLRDNLTQSLTTTASSVRTSRNPVAIPLSVNLRQNGSNLLSLKSNRFLCKQNNEGLPVKGHSLLESVRPYSSQPESPLPKWSKQDTSKMPITWRNVLIIAGVGCVLVLAVEYLKRKKELERTKAHNRQLGKAQLGGDWTLTDHFGNKRSSTEFRGQWLMIYFGFTHCPDVCPDEIEKIVEVISKTDSDKDLPTIQPIIITVDPERDTPQALKEYCAEFSPRLLGFTGSPEEIHQATHAYRVYYSPGPKDEDSDYIVDHSVISYLVNPRGEFVDYFGQNKTVSEIYNSIKLHYIMYLKKEKLQ